jgi:hypothetical protein
MARKGNEDGEDDVCLPDTDEEGNESKDGEE